MAKRTVKTVLFILVPLVFISCSINKMAVRALADSLSGTGSTVFTGDNDPELVGDALPFALKLYESILEQVPDHKALTLSTGSAFVMYANAFIATPASYLTVDKWDEQTAMYQRAKRMYLRGRDLLLEGLNGRYPGFLDALKTGNASKQLSSMKKDDAAWLYWAAAGWFGAYSLNPFDFVIGATISQAAVLMDTAYALDPDFNNGSIDEFYILYYASMPDGMGGDTIKARKHFDLAVKKTDGMSASPYVALAGSISIKEQNPEEFQTLLKTALAIDPEKRQDIRLVNVVNQRKAQWYLNHIEDFFLIESEEPSYESD